MKKVVFSFTALATITVFLFTIGISDAQWRNETHDVYNAPTGVNVTIDGDLSEWGEVMDAVTGTNGTAFCGVEFEANGGDIKAFEEYNGGVWNNANDHETCFMFAWDEDALYLALSVTDDDHEHAAAAAWNGDGAQLAVEPTGKREAGLPLFLYNIGLDGAGENVILQNERTNGSPGLVADDAAIVRDDAAKKPTTSLDSPQQNCKLKETNSVKARKSGSVSVSTMETTVKVRMDREVGMDGTRMLSSTVRIPKRQDLSYSAVRRLPPLNLPTS